MTAAAVRGEGLSKRFRIYHERSLSLKQTLLRQRRTRYEEFWALQDVSFTVGHGESLGIIGGNGSGKSTLLKCIAGILSPDRGSVEANGRLAALLELGAGFYPEYTGRENVYLNGALLGMSRRDIDQRFDAIVAFSGLERNIDNTVKTYSSGQFARLGFAIAVHLEPEILIVDEILAVGDEAFQRRCFERIAELQAAGTTMIVVSHSLEQVKRLCRRSLWLDAGRVRLEGDTAEVVQTYLTDVAEHLGLAIHSAGGGEHVLVERERGEIGVSRVVIHTGPGDESQLPVGAPLRVDIHYYHRGPLSGARFSLNLVRERDDVEAFWCATDGQGQAGELPAEGVVTLEVPSVQLGQGRYWVGVGITDVASGRDRLVLARAFPLEIVGDAPGARGVARLDYSWVLPGASARVSA